MAAVVKLVMLVLLLVVLAWRAQSCRQQIAAKRHAMELANARFDARTADLRSALPLDPFARRAAMAAQMRLRPDARFLRALERLTGAAPTASFAHGRWTCATSAGRTIGSLSELPTFAEMMDLLIQAARAQPRPSDGDRPIAPALQWEPEARAALATAVRTYEQKGDAAALRRAAGAAVSLAFYEDDVLQSDDELAAHAMALAAQGDAAGHRDEGRRALLAAALGYGAEARALAGKLSGGALGHYLTANWEGLREDASLRDAQPQDRYLWLRHLFEWGDHRAAFAFVDSALGTERFDLPVVLLLTRATDMERRAAPAFAMPWLLRAAAGGVRFAPNFAGDTVDALGSAISRSGETGHAVAESLEQALSRLDTETAGYLRALWLTALSRQGQFTEKGRSDVRLTDAFSSSLAAVNSETVRRFQSYFDLRAKLLRGDPMPAIASAGKLTGIGGAAIFELISDASGKADFADVRLVRATRDLVPRLDSRPSDRWWLSAVAFSVLQDLRTSYRMATSASAAAPDRFVSLSIWFATLARDDEALGRIAQDRARPGFSRLSACEGMSKRAGEKCMRALLEEDENDFEAARTLNYLLRDEGRPADGREVLLRWLRRNDGASLPAALVRGSISFDDYLLGDYQDGIEASKPALQVGNANAYHGAALNLASLGRADEARQAADALVQRYPFPTDVAIAVEVEWVLGDMDAAARRLAQSPARFRAQEYRDQVGKTFARLFGKQPVKAAEAARAIAAAGLDAQVLDEIGEALDGAKDYVAALQVREVAKGNPDAMLVLRLHAASSLRKSQGDAVAAAYLRAHLPIQSDSQAHRVAMVAWREADPKLVWDAVPDPQGQGDDAEQVWMMRAAEVASEGRRADPARVESLRAHYAASSDESRHAQIGRYLIGGLSEAAAAKLVTNLSAACEVPYYFGVRARGEGRRADAADWFTVAVECGQRSEAEYLYAYDALYRWRGDPDPFAHFH